MPLKKKAQGHAIKTMGEPYYSLPAGIPGYFDERAENSPVIC
jgi:hypothetical protein